jgi:pectate lyase
VLTSELGPLPDAPSAAAAIDQAAPLDEGAQIDQTEPSILDSAQMDEADALLGAAARPTPVPDAGFLLFDDFENGKAEDWEVMSWQDAGAHGSDWSVIVSDTGRVYAEDVLDQNQWRIAYASSGAVLDQIVEARMRVNDFYENTPSYVAALFARYDPSSDSGYFVALRGDGSLIIRKRMQAKNASWMAAVDANIVPGAWHTVRLEVVGSTARAFLDGELVYTVVDSEPLGQGTVALGTYGATVEVDQVFVTAP